QLQPIQAGAAFRAITERIGFAELAGVRRQRDEWAREASRLFARGEVEKGLDVYAQHGHLVEAATRQEAIGRIVADWTEARKQAIDRSVSEGRDGRLRGDELLVLAHTNDDVHKLNEALRQVMRAQQALSDSRTFQTERGTREFAAGDRIIFLENARFLEPRERHSGPQYVKNGMLGTIISTGDKRGDPLLSVLLDNGDKVVFSEDSYRNVDHGYAATIHKSQGATVDRTFVLATGMMDQHLTYVSMTRHRDRVDLYSAKEDFEAKPEWGRKLHVDHAAGVTGELVETGEAKFRPNDEDADDSPYADVRTEDGTVHRLWGVSLPKALEEAGISAGDTVTLRKDGVERVKVQIAVVDEETGQKRYEEREVDRNVWTARQIETAEARQHRLERESHRPDMFKQLVERLSRSGAKTTTLDFESGAGYRAQAQDFARRRGIDHLSLAAVEMEESLSRRFAWIAAKREQVERLWERASVALGFAIERERRVAYNEERSERMVEATSSEARYLIPPTFFARSVEEDARLMQRSSPAWTEREAILLSLLEKIYRDPDAALAALNALASDAGVEPRKLADDLAAAPDRLGRLRGSELIVDGRAARQERNVAMSAVDELRPLARAHATEFRRNAERFEQREQTRRSYMSVSIPALSENAMARLMEIEAVRTQGGDDAYKSAFALATEDRSVVQEIKAVSEALTARFGWSAFTAKADAVAGRNVAERMPEDLMPSQRETLINLFEAVKRFGHEQHLAERQDRSKIVAAASAVPTKEPREEPGKDYATVLPMLAAVTEFKTPVDEEARSRVLAAPLYHQQRAALANTARTIWRDPAGAVSMIEELILKGFAADRIAAAVTNDPAAYGALRGSDRLMDKVLASGRERKEAVQAVPEAAVRLRSLGSSYVNLLDAERRSITAERQRMAVAIPGLSRAAEEALIQRMAQRKNGRMLNIPAAPLDANIRREFADVSKALDQRFGRNAIIRGDKELINHVSPTQRPAFAAMQERLKVLQQTVRHESSEEIIAERRQRAVSRGRSIDL
ncbi:hypothetical protein Rleg4DRAFT_4353, partial [Rhizobium leguminosarum bv. trifolii WSM2297]